VEKGGEESNGNSGEPGGGGETPKVRPTNTKGQRKEEEGHPLIQKKEKNEVTSSIHERKKSGKKKMALGIEERPSETRNKAQRPS